MKPPMPSSEPLVIHDHPVDPGGQAVIRIPVGRLPSGNQVQIRVHVFRSDQPGPVVLFLAGVHGDEVNGVEIVRQALRQRQFDDLLKGTVIAIPVLNLYGFNHFTREVPDGKDVNRSFPGSVSGSLASRLAGTISKKILPHIDFGVDFHTGGRSHYNYPQLRFSPEDERAARLAALFAAPFTLVKRPMRRSLRKIAQDQSKSMLVFEGGENNRIDPFPIEIGLNGMSRLLYHHGMLGDPPGLPAGPQSLVFEHSTWLRAPRAGIFRRRKDAGQGVAKGEILGLIGDPFGQEVRPVLARHNAYILGHNNAPIVSQGDALFHLGHSDHRA